MKEDIQFVKNILPNHYSVQESKKKGSIHCKSEIGIRHSPYLNESSGNMVTDHEDEEHWAYILGAIKQHFNGRFQEVYHNTCFCHVDFTIYLKPQTNE
jgi:mannose-6-phosphate isomerase-like protein (cupin superfamily)